MSLFSKPCVTLTVPSSQASARGGYEGRARYPPFKKKHGDQAAACAGTAFKWEGKSLTLAGMRTPLDIRWSRPLPQRAQPTTVTVTKGRAHRYFVSILVEEDIKALPGVNKQVGLDPGLKRMVITGDGESHGNPKFLKDEKKLAKAHRRLARKKKGSKNRARARRSRKLARLHARIVDKRRDYQHRLTAKIVRENQVVCMETLQIKIMLKNHSLAKAMSDVGWSEFVRQVEYKARWYGRTLIKIEKFYPSSKRCFDCGHILDSLSLDVREWTCPQCDVHPS